MRLTPWHTPITRLRPRVNPNPYCPPGECTQVQVVGGKSYSDEYDTTVCVFCHCYFSIRRASDE